VPHLMDQSEHMPVPAVDLDEEAVDQIVARASE
jgi:hypothetical protein